MDYTIAVAKSFIGKRIIVSLRYIDENKKEAFSGLWGVVDSVHEGGMLLKIEGGHDEEYWMFPPDLEALQPPSNKFYQLDGCETVVTDVDYDAYFSIAGSIDDLNSRPF